MSLFNDRSSHLNSGSPEKDIFRLSPHGCDVMFTRYEQSTRTGAKTNKRRTKQLLVSGSLCLYTGTESYHYKTGDWFEIEEQLEHHIHYKSDCSLIEFWFDPAANSE